ncbi:hypothetical protein O6H91_14G071000 [Diphasiastrum complanatum]|nr:hypothetical protein O6H91_14G071000 [Diphasiastrum complanatum]
MWEFAVGLFMIAIRPGSLVLPAMYGLVEAASVAAFGVVVGEWVDKFPRLKVAQVSLGVQNGSIVTAALAVVVLLVHPNSAPGGFKVFIMLVALVNAFGAVGALAGLANNILVERDWVVIIAEGQAPGLLTRINAGMRRIDLSCKLLAPVAVGVLMSSVSILASAVLIATWNLLSVGFEYWLLYSVYSAIPALQQYKDNQQVSSKTTHSSYSEDIDNDIQVADGLHTAEIADYRQLPTQDSNVGVVSQKQGTLVSLIKGLEGHVFQFFHGWNVYIYQEAALAAVALALLYFTVLSFGTLMTAFLQMRGVPPYVLGLARAVAAAVGIAATFIYPILQARLQTIRVGIWSIWLQWVFLGVSVASIWVQNNKISSSMLIGGVAASRLGLWMFDLSVTQLMQESVPEAERGVVGGVQNSVQSLMDMLSYVIAVFAPRPQDFGKLVLISYGVVSTAAMLYSFHVRRVRGHLVHIDHYLRSR